MQTISEAELEIMHILWDQGEKLPFSPLMEALESRGKRWKANTILTFLARLADKGMVEITKNGRLNEYTAIYSQSQYLEGLTQSFLHKVYGGDAKGLVAALIRQDRLSRVDVEELRRYWEEETGDA